MNQLTRYNSLEFNDTRIEVESTIEEQLDGVVSIVITNNLTNADEIKTIYLKLYLEELEEISIMFNRMANDIKRTRNEDYNDLF